MQPGGITQLSSWCALLLYAQPGVVTCKRALAARWACVAGRRGGGEAGRQGGREAGKQVCTQASQSATTQSGPQPSRQQAATQQGRRSPLPPLLASLISSLSRLSPTSSFLRPRLCHFPRTRSLDPRMAAAKPVDPRRGSRDKKHTRTPVSDVLQAWPRPVVLRAATPPSTKGGCPLRLPFAHLLFLSSRILL